MRYHLNCRRVIFCCFGLVIVFYAFKPQNSVPHPLKIATNETSYFSFNYSASTTNNNTNPTISLLMRMSGKRKDHKTRFYCNMLKTILIFWPGWLGKTVIVLDAESNEDYTFAATLLNQTTEHFPDHSFEMKYEALPIDPTVLRFPGQKKPSGYNRQLWSSFFMDLYTDDDVIAWLDSDSPFLLPVTMSTIMPNGRVRILGTDCTMGISWVKSWAKSTRKAIGWPQVADFMTYFPVYLYRDTITNCRNHILKTFQTNNFEEAFKKFYHTGTGLLSPVNVIISYAWFFENNRYEWKIELCNNLDQLNKRLPHSKNIMKESTVDESQLLTQPQTAYHGPLISKDFYANLIPISYCLSIKFSRQENMCKKYSWSDVKQLFSLFKSDMHSVRVEKQHPCVERKTQYCLEILKHHIKKVGVEIRENKRRMSWNDVTIVNSMAKSKGIICPRQPL
ncbi:uncharacterized protein LOC124436905 [Xenia sp. Carnegie-2017]|uniref:uncharacterized protein LOC124436905 n=1 Tax=Xenia sp. Carnegie-2017 TaxID=2897299 RepID=UPI001F03AF41|nr:uncharacterized protein LOC124436905 [Xenia sp. Carnegie-2017]